MAGVQVLVPRSRALDVAAVTGSGAACSGSAFTNGGGAYQIPVRADGTCHVVVSFRSGASYADDVKLGHCSDGACCAACGPEPDHIVNVPEGDGGNAQ